MPAVTVPVDALALGPGFLYWAPLASTEPTHTVSGSVFTDTWPGAWLLLGATDKGSEFAYELNVDEVEVAEYLDPVAYTSTGRATGLSFALAQMHATNIKRAMNGGTITTSGTGATLLSEFVPPDVGQEVRAMIGWEAQDSTERLIGYQCLQVGKIGVERRKGAEKAMLNLEYKFEKPASGPPFKQWFAGTKRG